MLLLLLINDSWLSSMQMQRIKLPSPRATNVNKTCRVKYNCWSLTEIVRPALVNYCIQSTLFCQYVASFQALETLYFDTQTFRCSCPLTWASELTTSVTMTSCRLAVKDSSPVRYKHMWVKASIEQQYRRDLTRSRGHWQPGYSVSASDELFRSLTDFEDNEIFRQVHALNTTQSQPEL